MVKYKIDVMKYTNLVQHSLDIFIIEIYSF
jgi:hypothetical protein